jgi:tryptophan-rich sensory protein
MRLLLFFVLNFGALALGSYLMGEGPMGSWYTNLNKAPWTPPGWVFGASWTLIMICLSIFMNKAVQIEALSKTILWIYGVQLVLNILWNPLFFDLNWMGIALIEIILLVFVVGFMAYQGKALSAPAYLATYSLRGVAKYRDYAKRLRTAEQLTS